MLATSSKDKIIKIWKANNLELIKTLDKHNEQVLSVVWNPVNPNHLFSGGVDPYILIWGHDWELTCQLNSRCLKAMEVTIDGK